MEGSKYNPYGYYVPGKKLYVCKICKNHIWGFECDCLSYSGSRQPPNAGELPPNDEQEEKIGQELMVYLPRNLCILTLEYLLGDKF